MELEIRKLNNYVVEIYVQTIETKISLGLFSLSEQKELAEHLIYAAEDLLSRNFEYKLQSEMLYTIAENL